MTSHDRLEAEEMARLSARALLSERDQVMTPHDPDDDRGPQMFAAVGGIAVVLIVIGALTLWAAMTGGLR